MTYGAGVEEWTLMRPALSLASSGPDMRTGLVPNAPRAVALSIVMIVVAPGNPMRQEAATSSTTPGTVPPLLLLWAQQQMDVAFDCEITHLVAGEEPSRDRCIVNRSNEVARFGYGTASGITGVLEDGTPLYGLEGARLVSASGEWSRYQRSTTGDLTVRDVDKARIGLLDIRSIAFVPMSLCQTYSPAGCIEHLDRLLDCREIELRETNVDGAPCVEAHCPERGRRVVWHFHPEHPGRLTRVEDWHHGRRHSATEFVYQRFDSVALPVKVRHMDCDDRVLGLTEISYRNVNSPEIPDPLTPGHIGFLVGSIVNVQGDGKARQMVWAGDRLVSREEYDDLKRQGLIEDDPQVVAWLERAKARGPIDINARRRTSDVYGKPSTEPIIVPRPDAAWRHRITPLLKAPDQSDEWTRYVENFIRTYKLDQDQAARCRQFLADALERRAQYLRSRRERLQSLAEREYKTAGDARLGQEELGLILRPVERLFDELKARLRPVPARKQRADAGETAGEPGAAPEPARTGEQSAPVARVLPGAWAWGPDHSAISSAAALVGACAAERGARPLGPPRCPANTASCSTLGSAQSAAARFASALRSPSASAA